MFVGVKIVFDVAFYASNIVVSRMKTMLCIEVKFEGLRPLNIALKKSTAIRERCLSVR